MRDRATARARCHGGIASPIVRSGVRTTIVERTQHFGHAILGYAAQSGDVLLSIDRMPQWIPFRSAMQEE